MIQSEIIKPTRLTVLPDERRLILGIDKANIFKEGVVYSVVKICDEIVLKPIGEMALPEKGQYNYNQAIDKILYTGLHLITKEEQKIAQSKMI